MKCKSTGKNSELKKRQNRDANVLILTSQQCNLSSIYKKQTIETVNTREHSQPAYGAAERKLGYEFVFVGIVKNAKLQLF